MTASTSTGGTTSSSSCPVSSFDGTVDRLVEIIKSSDNQAFERILDWLRGENLPDPAQKRLSRLGTARAILEAIHSSFPTTSLDNHSSSNHETTTINTPVQHSIRPPPSPLPYFPLTEAAFPPLVAKKEKKRIRPATLSTTPLSNNTTAKTGVHTNSVWGKTTAICTEVSSVPQTAWPPRDNLLESRLFPTNAATTAHSVTTTPTKPKPIVNLSPCPTPIKATPTKQISMDTTKDLVDPEKLKQSPSPTVLRLVQLYATLVQALLVPSTPNEVVFLLGLLHSATTQATWQPADDLSCLWPNSDDGRVAAVHFGTRVLTLWSDRLLGWGLANALVDCPPLQQYCPKLVQCAQDYLFKSEPHRSSHPRTTAFWTLPFDEQRDSRNRYRTTDEVALYKNREETRDAFVSHLRRFYHQGTVHTSTTSVERIRPAVRAVMDPLWDDNLPWLAELFTDLLLQLGLVPVQETDREVLKMASQEKVQKLHQRFKAPARKSSSNQRLSKKPAPVHTGSRTMAVQEEYFRGHQEFFYYFVILADSHKLNQHLRHQFLEKITNLSTHLSPSNIDRGLEDLCLLGRFLGVLVFSPNWHSSKLSLDESRSRSLVYDEFGALRFGNLDATALLLEASRRCRLVSIVPWMVELLRMSIWDDSFRRTKSFCDTAFVLRRVQDQNARNLHPASGTCREFLLLCLETFIDEIVGLDLMENYEPRTGKDFGILADPDETDGLDSQIQTLDSSFISGSNGRAENVLHAVVDMTRFSRGLRRSPGVSRKVRPSMVMSTSAETGHKPRSREPELDEDARLQMKLKASFFHMHRELQLICDFAVERVINSMYDTWKKVGVESLLVSYPDHSVDWDATETGLVDMYSQIMRKGLERCLQQSLDLFSPDYDENIKRLAISISLEEGMKNGQTKLDAMVLETLSSLKAKNAKTNEKSNKMNSMGTDEEAEVKFSEVVLNLQGCLACLKEMKKNTNSNECLPSLQKARSTLEAWILMATPENPAEESLREFFSTVSDLDNVLVCLLKSVVVDEKAAFPDLYTTVKQTLYLAATCMNLCTYGFPNVKCFLADAEQLSRLLSLTEDGAPELVQALRQARLISISHQSKVLRGTK